MGTHPCPLGRVLVLAYSCAHASARVPHTRSLSTGSAEDVCAVVPAVARALDLVDCANIAGLIGTLIAAAVAWPASINLAAASPEAIHLAAV
jgi:hypothetical protein